MIEALQGYADLIEDVFILHVQENYPDIARFYGGHLSRIAQAPEQLSELREEINRALVIVGQKSYTRRHPLNAVETTAIRLRYGLDNPVTGRVKMNEVAR